MPPEYDIANAVGAENAVNARFGRGEVLDEGILIYHCHARLSSAKYGQFVIQQDAARRDNIVKAYQHETAIDDQKRANQLAKIKQDGEHVLRADQVVGLGSGERRRDQRARADQHERGGKLRHGVLIP